MSNKSEILSWLLRYDFSVDEVDWGVFLIDIAEHALCMSRIEAEQFASNRNIALYWSHLQGNLDEFNQRGLSPLFVTQDQTRRRLSVIGRLKPSQVIGVLPRQHRVASHRPSLLRRIDALSDREYEGLGALCSKLLGAKKVLVTPAKNEGGVDFYASMVIRKDCHLFGPTGCCFRLVGQVKQYNNKMEVGEMKSFCETLNEIRQQSRMMTGHVPAWFFQDRGPIVGWAISHNGFQQGAMDKAHQQGVVCADSCDLAEIVLRSREYYIESPNKRIDAIQAMANNILKTT